MQRSSDVFCLVAAMLVGAMWLPAAADGATVQAGIVPAQARPDYRIRLKREADGLVAAGRRALRRGKYKKARTLFRRAAFLFPGHQGAAAGLRRVKAAETRARKKAAAAKRATAYRPWTLVGKPWRFEKDKLIFIGRSAGNKIYVYDKIARIKGKCKLITTLYVFKSLRKSEVGIYKYALRKGWICCDTNTWAMTGYTHVTPGMKVLISRKFPASLVEFLPLHAGTVGGEILKVVCRRGFGAR